MTRTPSGDLVPSDPKVFKGAKVRLYDGDKTKLTPEQQKKMWDFNRNLASNPTSILPPTPPPSPTGWQGAGGPMATGNYVSKYGTASVRSANPTASVSPASPIAGLPPVTPPATLGMDDPALGSYGNVPGMPSTYRAPAMPSPGNIPGLPQANGAAGDAGPPGVEAPKPAENAAQRWQRMNDEDRSAVRQISPQTRFYWATGRIDGRARQAPQNGRTDFDTTFGPNRSHMGNAGTTWDQRQANNQAGQAAAAAQRNLPEGWDAY